MVSPEIADYIKKSRASGVSDAQIKQSLLQSGWNEIQVNEAFGVPTPPSNAPIPPPAAPATGGFNANSFFDKKTKDTVIWSAVGYLVSGLIVAVATSIAASVFLNRITFYGQSFYVGSGFHLNIFNTVVSSLIYGAIFGMVIAKFYPQLQRYSQQYFKGFFNSLYKIIFYPSLLGGVLGLIFSGVISSLFGAFAVQFMIYMVIVIVASIVGSYIYAKLMVSKVGQYYR